jgi:hypothetical protein
MNFKYICGGKSFYSENDVLKYASEAYVKENIILGIEKVEVPDEERMNLIDSVIFQIKLDMENGDLTAIEELLNLIPSENLYSFLSDKVKEEMENA